MFYPKDVNGELARWSLIEASTKAGKTVSGIAWLYEMAFVHGQLGRNFWWVAPVSGQARIAFRRLKLFLPPGQIADTNQQDMTITLPNGGVIWFKSGDKPDSLYGEDVWAAVIDEASRCKEESWHAVRSTLTATRGPCRMIGNVKGRRNWFFKMARKAEAGEPGSSFHKITAADAVAAGVLAADEIESAKHDLPEAVFKELYYAEASDDQGNPFGLAFIDAIVKPLSKLPVVVWGIDLAKKRDWTVIIGLDKNGDVAHFERFQKSWDETTNRIIDLVSMDPALIDATGVGDPIVERIQKKCPDALGYIFTQPSKQRIMEGLAVSIQRRETSCLDGIHKSELESFEYEYTRTGVRYCLAPETRVLKRDLNWVPIESLLVGDELVGFDENRKPGNKTRRWATAKVLRTKRIYQPCYRIELEDGTEVISSSDHQWLVNSEGAISWRATDALKAKHEWSTSRRHAPTKMMRLLDIWDPATSYEAGYLAAAFDGEGHISQGKNNDNNGHTARIGFAQKENAMAVEMRRCMEVLGFKWAEHWGKNTDVGSFELRGMRPEFLRFLGQVRPKRLLAKFNLERFGVIDRKAWVPIKKIEYIGLQPVIAIQTSTRTFVAEGLASHNCAPEGFTDDAVYAHGLAVSIKGKEVDLTDWEKLV